MWGGTEASNQHRGASYFGRGFPAASRLRWPAQHLDPNLMHLPTQLSHSGIPYPHQLRDNQIKFIFKRKNYTTSSCGLSEYLLGMGCCDRSVQIFDIWRTRL